jgi:hypothetical protein
MMTLISGIGGQYDILSTVASTSDDRGVGVFCWVLHGADSAVYKGLTLLASGDTGAGAVSSQALNLGADAAAANPWAGKIAHPIIYQGSHTATQVARTASALSRHYGVGL